MDTAAAREFVDRWVENWNAHDLDALLAHFTDDVVFTSPIAVAVVPDSGGVLRGKDALRHYWSTALRMIPDLHFEVLAHYVGVSTIVINYRNQRGGVVSEVLQFDGDADDALVSAGHGTYLAEDGANPAGLRS